ncbi:putative delta-60 repeat protein/predicted secreted protein (Por secretion system target) [Nonlabens dokdonensis]|jgi:uncharacterized delta-60 repeat protein|uniref:Delta-60 repeat protein/predicted secreted protein (Por secretion system target) n=1 Tax=Nonlabens dokdonensis TaxID=328515 RepID=A0ABX5PXL5_9FLAO|nr:T9SS type A sorting domain-containing protein [Nonlabens dokdonensis]PZX39932.1 putative delta-60 repeat protein/predicted secreted protein (Por secretion system target) [Nonlabens dokdonensis]
MLYSVALWIFLENGKIGLLGTYSTFFSGTDDVLNVSVLNADGSFDTTFSPTGINTYQIIPSQNNRANDILFQPDGKLLMMYRSTPSGAGYNSLLTRLNTDGTVDTSFAPSSLGHSNNNFSLNASTTISEFYDMELMDDGTLFTLGFGNNFAPTWFDAVVMKILIPDAALSNEDVNTIDFKVFPNPASGILNFQTTLPIDKVELYDTLGRLLSTQFPLDYNLSLEHLNRKQNVILAKFYSNNQIITKKVVIKK